MVVSKQRKKTAPFIQSKNVPIPKYMKAEKRFLGPTPMLCLGWSVIQCKPRPNCPSYLLSYLECSFRTFGEAHISKFDPTLLWQLGHFGRAFPILLTLFATRWATEKKCDSWPSEVSCPTNLKEKQKKLEHFLSLSGHVLTTLKYP